MKQNSDFKYCRTCDLLQPYEQFSWKILNKKRQSNCKSCHSKYLKNWYEYNRNKQIANVATNQKKYLAEQRVKLREYLLKNPCVDCGFTDIRALEFDHLDNKKNNISSMIGKYAWSTVETEIEKCAVRCANCHRIKTAIDFNYWSNSS